MSFDAVGIISKNLEKTKKFYALFGLELEPTGGSEHLEAKTSSGVRIMVDSVTLMKELNPKWVEPQGSGMVLCFKQSSAKEVNNLCSKIMVDGFECVNEPWDAFWGQRYASVLDPDGNQIDIFAPL